MTDLSLAERLEQEAARRFVRWNPGLWREIVQGPARELARGLHQAGHANGHGERVIEAYLRLAMNGIGLGYLFPAASMGAQNLFTLAWMDLIPRLLPASAAEQHGARLASLWNLAENLENESPWLKVIFRKRIPALTSLDTLEPLVEEVARLVLAPPERKLPDQPDVKLVWLAEDDRRFLPGRVEFVEPTIAVVYDRFRDGRDGKQPVTVGVWLNSEPTLLGAMGIDDPPGAVQDPDLDRWEALAKRDARVTDVFDTARNEWRACATLMTSQMLVVLA